MKTKLGGILNSINEAKTVSFKLTQFTKPISKKKLEKFGEDMWELTPNGLLYINDDPEELALPFDGSLTEVTANSLTIEGGAGFNGFGRCSVTIPLNGGRFTQNLIFTLEQIEESNIRKVTGILDELGIKYEEEK